MFYIIYQITNLINSKIYIGKHQTNNLEDGYMGSGKLLRQAITKYGRQNFKKDVLFQFQTEQEMNAKEKELITEEFLKRPDVYNICPGGKGGWGYINNIPTKELVIRGRNINTFLTEIDKSNRSKKAIITQRCNKTGMFRPDFHIKYAGKSTFLGKTHSTETKRKIGQITAIAQSGEGNSQYGTCWITNGQENKKIKKEDIDTWLNLGYIRGRKI